MSRFVHWGQWQGMGTVGSVTQPLTVMGIGIQMYLYQARLFGRGFWFVLWGIFVKYFNVQLHAGRRGFLQCIRTTPMPVASSANTSAILSNWMSISNWLENTLA
jgi:hypothetical protein